MALPRGQGGRWLRGPGGKPAASTACCCEPCLECGTPTNLCATNVTIYDMDGTTVIAGPYNATLMWGGSGIGWASVDTSIPGLSDPSTCPLSGFNIVVCCAETTDGMGNPIPCSQHYGLSLSLNCCDTFSGPAFLYQGTDVTPGCNTIIPVSKNPLKINVDVNMVDGSGADGDEMGKFCLFSVDGGFLNKRATPTRVTMTIGPC